MNLLDRGGWVMIPLGVCSLAALTLLIERVIVLVQARRAMRDLVARVDPLLREGSLDRAEAACRASRSPLARVLEAGLRRAGEPPETIASTMRECAAVEIPPLYARIGFLASLAQICITLGFLGTVTGMMRVFESIEIQSRLGRPVGPGDLAGGIWEKLITTASGLVIAIPTYLASYILGEYANALTGSMERYAYGAAELLARPQRRPEPGRGRTPTREREEVP